jgi:hypothetical protein
LTSPLVAFAALAAVALAPQEAPPSPPAPPAPPPAAGAPAQSEAEPSFVRRVNAAVDRADDWLKRRQGGDGGYDVYHFHSGRDYVAGQTALALLARVAAGGEVASETTIERGFDWLKRHPPQLTYEVGLTLMAFDARAAPIGERNAIDKMSADELAKYAFPRRLDGADRDFLQALVDRLGRERFHECWSYGSLDPYGAKPGTADMSNTQYAVLGLKAASRLGLRFDRQLFADVLEYFLDHQEQHGEKVKYVDQRDSPDGKPRRYAKRVESKGWAYVYGARGSNDVYASMTCVGIACVVLSLDDLLTKGAGSPQAVARKRHAEANAAVESALAWLDQNFAVDHHPGEKPPPIPPNAPPPAAPPAKSPDRGYFYYYLYALERVGALTARRYIGEHDWYREGAEELLKRQLADGSWPSGGYDNELVNTCFALLFLRRATLRGSVTGSSDR